MSFATDTEVAVLVVDAPVNELLLIVVVVAVDVAVAALAVASTCSSCF
jgi:hypothetical protein